MILDENENEHAYFRRTEAFREHCGAGRAVQYLTRGFGGGSGTSAYLLTRGFYEKILPTISALPPDGWVPVTVEPFFTSQDYFDHLVAYQVWPPIMSQEGQCMYSKKDTSELGMRTSQLGMYTGFSGSP